MLTQTAPVAWTKKIQPENFFTIRFAWPKTPGEWLLGLSLRRIRKEGRRSSILFPRPLRNEGTLLFDRLLGYPAQSDLVHGSGLVALPPSIPPFQKEKGVDRPGIGYLTGFLSVWIYCDFAASYAPTKEIADEILSKDGAPQVFAPMVMPFFVGVYSAFMWPITCLVTRICPIEDKESANNANLWTDCDRHQ